MSEDNGSAKNILLAQIRQLKDDIENESFNSTKLEYKHINCDNNSNLRDSYFAMGHGWSAH